MKGVFSFDKLTGAEKKKADKAEKELVEKVALAKQRLVECISSDTFAKYKEELDKADRALIKVGISIMLNISDNVQRLSLYDKLFTRADVLGSLLKSINKDSVDL